MAALKINLDAETDRALLADAARHLRPVDWHAKALLRVALGLPFPYPPDPRDFARPQIQEVTP
jgi:plasmid stability protein